MTTYLTTVHGYDTHANRPAVAAANAGYIYGESDTKKIYRSDGTTWTLIGVLPQLQTLTDGATISWDLSLGDGVVTLAGNRTLAAPTNLQEGYYSLRVIQDATGSRTLTWNAAYVWPGGTAPALTTTASGSDVFTFYCNGTSLYSVSPRFPLLQTLTDGATISWDLDLGNGVVTLAGNRTLAAPTNLRVGYVTLRVIQDGTGSRTLTWNAAFKWPGGTAPALTTTAAGSDLFVFYCDGTSLYYVSPRFPLLQTLTDQATVTWDLDLGNGVLTLGGNRTLAAPTNLRVGYVTLRVIQDGTGSRTITWNAVFKWPGGTAPVLTTTAAGFDTFLFYCDGTSLYFISPRFPLLQTLTDGATINWNLDLGSAAVVTLAGNRTLAAPTNLRAGYVTLRVIQDGTGSRTLTWNAAYVWPGGTAPSLTTTAAGFDVFVFYCDGTSLYAVLPRFPLLQVLTDQATVTWNTDLGSAAVVTLGGNRTLAAPTNLRVGYYSLRVVQDGTGSRLITWNGVFKWPGGTAPTLTTTAAHYDLIVWYCDGTSFYRVNTSLDLS